MQPTYAPSIRSVSPNGYCIIPINGVPHTVIGGPFDAFAGGYGVCLEKNSSKARMADLLVDVPDFGVPTYKVFEDTLETIVRQMLAHPTVPVFVGCRGGIGRTGLVIAGLVRAVGVDVTDPVGWVRRHYLSHAVETPDQRLMVSKFDVRGVRALIPAPMTQRKPSFYSALRDFFSLRR